MYFDVKVIVNYKNCCNNNNTDLALTSAISFVSIIFGKSKPTLSLILLSFNFPHNEFTPVGMALINIYLHFYDS